MTERAHTTHLQLLANLEDEPRERDYPKDDNAPSIDVTAFWAKTAARLFDENAQLKAQLGDLRLAADAVRGAKSELERTLAASVLVEMAVRQ